MPTFQRSIFALHHVGFEHRRPPKKSTKPSPTPLPTEPFDPGCVCLSARESCARGANVLFQDLQWVSAHCTGDSVSPRWPASYTATAAALLPPKNRVRPDRTSARTTAREWVERLGGRGLFLSAQRTMGGRQNKRDLNSCDGLPEQEQ